MGALSPETVELISTTEEGAVRDRVSARFIVMAAHEMSLEKWLRDNRETVDFTVASLLCKQFGEVTSCAPVTTVVCVFSDAPRVSCTGRAVPG
jgi:hypothetical protein